MLIDHYDLDVFTPPCSPGAERYAAIARLTADISVVFPYLNAVLDNAMYNPAAPALTCKHEGRHVTLNPYEIATGGFEDRNEATQMIDSLVEQINCAWERRNEITPDYRVRQRPAPLAVYKLMPQTNCKVCGEPTCYVFATKLAVGQRQVADCPTLAESSYADNLANLQELLIDITNNT